MMDQIRTMAHMKKVHRVAREDNDKEGVATPSLRAMARRCNPKYAKGKLAAIVGQKKRK